MPVSDRVPRVKFMTRVHDASIERADPSRWAEKSTSDFFAGKRVVVFSLPGAFTPTCSSSHLPRYDELYERFLEHGIDDIICVSVNDAFLMCQWGKHIGNRNITLLPDGNGEFTRKMGMLVEKSNLGYGMRSWRYSMLVDDGVIERIFVEPEFDDNCPTDPFEVSDADTMLAFISGAPPQVVSPEEPPRERPLSPEEE